MEYITISVLLVSVFFLLRSLLIQKKQILLLNEQKNTLEKQLYSHKSLTNAYSSIIDSAKNSANISHLYGELLLEEELNPESKDLLNELLLANESVIHILKKNSV